MAMRENQGKQPGKKPGSNQDGVKQYHQGYDADDLGHFETGTAALPKGFGPWVLPGMGRGYQSSGSEVHKGNERRKFPNLQNKPERRKNVPWAAYGLRVGAHELGISQEALQKFVTKSPLVQMLREKHGVTIGSDWPAKGIAEISRRSVGRAIKKNPRRVHEAFEKFVALAREHAEKQQGN
ncbi:MAG: hypothetical protein WC792_05390 [Candidatus Micrarchaeia archaeon]|jgi:hypothetical protein